MWWLWRKLCYLVCYVRSELLTLKQICLRLPGVSGWGCVGMVLTPTDMPWYALQQRHCCVLHHCCVPRPLALARPWALHRD